MRRDDISDNTILLALFLLCGIYFTGFIIFADYVGIPLGDIDDENINIIDYCFAFISLLLAWWTLYFIFFKKIDSDWTIKQKTAWRYCIIGASALVLISIPIEYMNISVTLKRLLQIGIGIWIAFYFYLKFYAKFINNKK